MKKHNIHLKNYKDAKEKNNALNTFIKEKIGRENVKSIEVTYHTKTPQTFEFQTKFVHGSGILIQTTEQLFGDVLLTAGKYTLDIYMLIGFTHHSEQSVDIAINYEEHC